MQKRFLVVVFLAAVFAISHTPAAYADETGCKIVLCLSNPGGAKQYAECHEPISVLESSIKKHKPWPKCNEANASYHYDPFIACEESYGEGYQPHGLEYGGTVCSKLVGYDPIDSRPIYDEKPQLMREKPYYMEIEGSTERYWFNLR
jgi:hypothetical protein